MIQTTEAEEVFELANAICKRLGKLSRSTCGVARGDLGVGSGEHPLPLDLISAVGWEVQRKVNAASASLLGELEQVKAERGALQGCVVELKNP